MAYAIVAGDAQSMTSTSRHLREGVSLIILLVERVPPPRFNAGEVYLSAEEEYTMIFIMFMGLHATYHIARGLRTTRV